MPIFSVVLLFGDFPEEFRHELEGLPDTVLVVRYPERVNEETLPAGVKKVFAVSHGYDNIDTAFLEREGIEFHRVPSGSADVAEWCVMAAIHLLRKLPFSSVSGWVRPEGLRLRGKTWGIVGLGVIGREVAALVSRLGCVVKAYDPYVEGDLLVGSLDELAGVDILSVHVPLTGETKGLIGREFLQKFGGVLIDVSRGGVVDFDGAIDLLKDGHLRGAAFDVFPEEPFPGVVEEGLNLLLTPHMASLTRERWMDAARFIKESLSRNSTRG